MRFNSVILLWILVLGGAAAQPVSVEPFQVERESGRLRAFTAVKVEGQFEGKIRVPTEGVLVTGMGRQLKESDVLGSGLRYDLNGDGDSDDTFELKREGERWFLGGLEVKPFMQKDYTQSTSLGQVYRLNDKGPGFIVYATRPRVVAGADHHGVKARFLQLPNPFFQAVLLEPCDGPEGQPKLKLEGAQHLVYSYEPGLFPGTSGWMRVQWLARPVDKVAPLLVSGSGKGILLGRVNYSEKPGVRQRTDPVFYEVDLP